jgi:hypothetical protein
MEVAEGYVTQLALDEDGEIIGYEYLNLGKMMAQINNGVTADEALANSKGTYGRFDEAVKTVNPRQD